MCKDKIRFTHLHTHTDASPDGLSTVDKLIKRAAELDYDSLAMTDHGTLGNTVSFAAEARAAGIKPIFGLEAYMLWNGQRHHVTLNSMNKAGFDNLIRMSNLSHENYTSGYPLMTIDMMDRYSEGVAAFTGCPASPIHAGEYEDGLEWAGTMAAVFKDRFYAEMMFVMDEDVVSRPLKIAKQLNLPILVTNDVHFPLKEQPRIHKIMTKCRKGYNYDSNSLWLKDPAEMIEGGRYIFEEEDMVKWMTTAWEFSQMVEAWDIRSKPVLPEAEELVKKFYTRLEGSLEADIDWRPPSEVFRRRERYAYELKILEDAGFIDYFAILYDVVEFAHEKEILIGPGRGSAASSYLLYILGVTGIDPIHHDLPFERFMNPMRNEYPDVDLDFDSDRRSEVLEYAQNKWGAVPIATYSHYSHKVLCNDLGRFLGISPEVTKEAAERGPDSTAFKIFANEHVDVQPAYEAMEGQIRHTGKHAGGIIITNQVVPIENVGGSLVAAWTQGKENQLADVGVVKFDFLGVQAITQIDMMRRKTNRIGLIPDPEAPENADVYSIFQEGDVLGIFQWTGSDGIRQLTMRINPTEFAHLVVINSLYRPGALDAGTADKYPDLMVSPRKFHPLVDPILEETYGAIVFQEQVMKLIQTMLGGTLAEADMARRLIFKPKPDKKDWVEAVEKMHEDFIAGGIRQGIDHGVMKKLWGEIMTHSRYSFNKSHSASYSLLAFEMAYFKLHHPEVFYSVMLTTDTANRQSYLIEAIAKGIEFLRPNVNKPLSSFEIEGDKIRMPLSIVNYLSADSATYIREEVEENGPFISYADFDKRIPGKKCTVRSIRFLWYLNAFDGLDGEITDIPRFKEEPEYLESTSAQMEALGFVIPSRKVAKAIRSSTDADKAFGYIHNWKDKRNKRGQMYRIYHLAPYGSFWLKDEDKIERIQKGWLVIAEKNNWGQALKVKKVTE